MTRAWWLAQRVRTAPASTIASPPSGQMEVLTEALRVAPGLAAATIIETRVGFRPVAPGVRPLLGTGAGAAGLVVGNGLGAAGLTIGPFAGRLLADVALGANRCSISHHSIRCAVPRRDCEPRRCVEPFACAKGIG